MKAKKVFKTLIELKTIILAFLFPIILLPILYGVDGDPGRCAYGVALLILYWMFEVFPLPITSLLPVLIFPALGIITSAEICSEYFKDPSITVICIFGIVAAIERWGLHKRIALGILLLFGTKPHWLILGMLVSTSVLSMFITVGVAVLMVPIVRSVAEKLRNVNPTNNMELEEAHQDRVSTHSEAESHSEGTNVAHEDEINQLYKALALCVCYGTSLGSTATLTGSPESFIMAELTAGFYRSYGLESQVTFISWLIFTLPIVLVVVILGWIWLVLLFLRGKGIFRRATATEAMKKTEVRVKAHLRAEYKRLGPCSYPEIMSLCFLFTLIVLFITQNLYFAPGWNSLFKKGYVGASGPACLIIVFLFIIPAKSPTNLLCGDKNIYDIKDAVESTEDSRFAPLLTWSSVERTTPWGVLLLFGAAFALVKASQVAGLTQLVGTYFETFVTLEPWILTLVITSLTTCLTEFISNSATITMLIPIIAPLGILAGIDPLALIFPLTLAAKFAFMMPIASPPNAVVYSLGVLRIIDMAAAGFMFNIIALITVNVGAQTWGKAYFKWDVLPEAMRINNTIVNNITAVS